jgi:Flp pilus assembly protein TadB
MIAMTDHNPFAEYRTPWWRRNWLRGKEKVAPKRYARAAYLFGGMVGFSLPRGHGVEHWILAVAFAVATSLPTYAVERWWRERRRRQAEQIVVLPSSTQITTR